MSRSTPNDTRKHNTQNSRSWINRVWDAKDIQFEGIFAIMEISFSAKFRNWDEVVVDSENSIKYTVFDQIEGS